MLNQIFNEDCLEGMKRIPDGSVDMILCDLPYGTTQNKWDTVIPFKDLWEQYERVIKPNGAIVLTASQLFTSSLVMSNPTLFKYQNVWHKRTVSGFLNAKKQPLRSHEDVCVFYRKQPTYNPEFSKRKHERDFTKMVKKPHSDNFGKQRKYVSGINGNSPAYPTSVIDVRGIVNNSKEKLPHPTQKPVPLFAYLIRTYTNSGDVVLDNCMGSGTTAIACLEEERQYIGFEKDEKYFQLGQERIAKWHHDKASMLAL